MSNPLKILSTKVLSPIQKNRMIELGARYAERNFIETKVIAMNLQVFNDGFSEVEMTLVIENISENRVCDFQS